MINIIKYKKIPFVLSGILVSASVILLLTLGLKPGVDFTGGSLLEIKFTRERPNIEDVRSIFANENLGEVTAQYTGEKNILLHMRFISEEEHQRILSLVREKYDSREVEAVNTVVESGREPAKDDAVVKVESSGAVEGINFEIPSIEKTVENTPEKIEQNVPAVLEERFETVGSAISADLRQRSIYAAVAVIIAIVLYIAYSFRKVSKPIKSWKYGVSAVIALIHDVTITMGAFSLLGHFLGVEVGIPFVVALLTILGYSVNDTIVVFDRIRENLIRYGYDNFEETVNLGVVQTISRSINTSLTVLLTLVAIFFFGGDSVHYFALALIIGIFFGTYSSIFLASPLLIVWERFKNR